MNNQNLDQLRHSCAHLFAAAITDLYPDIKIAIGPPIEDGFYYDVDFGDIKISEEDFPKIEQKMHELVKSWKGFERREVSVSDAKEYFKNNPYKLELIEEFSKKGEKITFFKSGNFEDLCRGGHIENPKESLKHFKLMSIAGAYWRGDEKNKMMTRVYGTVFLSKQELDDYLKMREEAKKRDHRKLGRELELFTISEQVGPGLPIFLPNGETIRQIIVDDLVKIKKENGYQFVWSPHIARSEIYHISQHWGKYDAMFNPMKLDKEEYVLKPMNCPHHFQVFMSRPRSYKELPFRIAENGTVYRNEKSGEVSGLVRVRSLTIDDTHTFIRVSQTSEEISKVLKLIKQILGKYGFKKYKARLSFGDRKNQSKYLGDPEAWEKAEATLKEHAEKLFDEVSIGVGEAAFYGPKIDVMVNDSLGREWQLSTCQLDYNQPKNFGMKYVEEDGQEVYPAILHIAMIGSVERFMGILIEHYSGAFPLWLSPAQVSILPISDKFKGYSIKIQEELVKNGIRVKMNDDSKTLGAKIRESTLQKIPYMIIIGEKEEKNKVISVRARDGKDLGQIAVSEFINNLKSQIENFS